MIGLKSEIDIPVWYPASASEKFEWYSFDGEKYNLDSPEYAEGVAKARALFAGGFTFESQPEEVKNALIGKNEDEAWRSGEVAMNINGSWILGGYGREFKFDVEFIGLPGGRPMLVPDYYGISSNSANPEAAFEFAKFISFGKEGYLKRLEIAKENDAVYIYLPITEDKGLVDKYLDFLPIRGLKEAYTHMDRAYIEGFKTIPHSDKARFSAETGLQIGDRKNATIGDVIFDSMRADLNFADYAVRLSDLANEALAEGRELLK